MKKNSCSIRLADTYENFSHYLHNICYSICILYAERTIVTVCCLGKSKTILCYHTFNNCINATKLVLISMNGLVNFIYIKPKNYQFSIINACAYFTIIYIIQLRKKIMKNMPKYYASFIKVKAAAY